MNILWLTWKDAHHPAAGGAELVASEICQRLLGDGHHVTMLTCGYEGAPSEEMLNGVRVIRVGNNRYSHSFQSLMYFVRHLRGKFDLIIEEVNGGAPYFSVLFAGKAKKVMLYHQLARVNWLYEIRHPFSYVGYYGLVPMATKIVSKSGSPVVTVSESTRQALAEQGFPVRDIHIISEGIAVKPLESVAATRKFARPTLLSLGAMRAMKRTLDQIEAFEIAKKNIPNLQLKIAGSAETKYGKRVLSRIADSPYRDSIEYIGKVSTQTKLTLMQHAHLIMQTAIEEGWGLTITEAASQGTPAVAYEVAGLRDSIKHEQTGIVTPERPEALAKGIIQALRNPNAYETMRRSGWEWSKQITFDQCYRDFNQVLQAI